MTHERLLELVLRVDVALAMLSGTFILYEAFAKSTPTLDLKAKLDSRRDKLFASVVLEIEETLRPYWPQRASRIILEPEFREETATAFSDDARDAIKDCLAESEGLGQASKMRGLAGRVLRWERACYWCAFSVAVLSGAGLATWFFYDGMPDRVAECAIIAPISPAILFLVAAATHRIHVHRANDAIIEENK